MDFNNRKKGKLDSRSSSLPATGHIVVNRNMAMDKRKVNAKLIEMNKNKNTRIRIRSSLQDSDESLQDLVKRGPKSRQNRANSRSSKQRNINKNRNRNKKQDMDTDSDEAYEPDLNECEDFDMEAPKLRKQDRKDRRSRSHGATKQSRKTTKGRPTTKGRANESGGSAGNNGSRMIGSQHVRFLENLTDTERINSLVQICVGKYSKDGKKLKHVFKELFRQCM